jgi:hypothetical protein
MSIAALGRYGPLRARHTANCPQEMACCVQRLDEFRIVLRRVIVRAFNVNGSHDDCRAVVKLDFVTIGEANITHSTTVSLACNDFGLDPLRDVSTLRSHLVLISQHNQRNDGGGHDRGYSKSVP